MQANTLAARSQNRLCWRACIIGLVLVGLIAGAALASDVTGVNVVNKSDRVVITVDGSGPLKMSVLSSAKGNYLGFQFAGHLLTKGRLVGIRSGRIYNIRYSRYTEEPPLTRVVLNTTAHLDYSTQWNDSKTRVEITVWKYGVSPAKTADKQPADSGATGPAVAGDFTPVPPAEQMQSQGSDTAEPVEAPAVTAKPAPAPAVSARPDPVPVVTVRPVPAPVVSVKPAQPAVKTTVVARIEPMAAPVRVAKAPAAPVHVTEAPATPASLGAGKAISLNFLAADIDDVLKALAVQSGENIVVGSDVTGKITVTLEGVTVEEALDYITQLSGYTYVKDQHTYLVGSAETVGGLTNAKVEIITLAYANADDVLEMLKAQCPQIRASKISVRGGRARKHEQTFEQGKTKSDASGQANINSQGQANVAATGQADANAKGNENGANKNASGNATVNAAGAAAGQTNSNAQGSMNVNAKRGIESLASSTATDSPSSDMIAIVGPEDRIGAAMGFIAQVEDAMKGQAEDRKVSVYEVKYVNTQELANTVMSLVLGVNVTLAPMAETAPVSAGQGQKIVPVSLLSGEKTDRPFDTEKNAFSHTLIIVGKAADVQKALDTAAQFDLPGETDFATYKVKYVDPDLLAKTIRQLVPAIYVEGLGITDADAGQSAAPTAAAEGTAGSTGAGSGAGMEATTMNAAMVNNLSRTLVITGRKGDVNKARTLMDALDVKSPQIRIEAKITSLTESGEKKLGFNWSWSDISFNEAFTDFVPVTTTNQDPTATVNSNTHNVKRENSQWIRQPWNVVAKLDALITSGDGKLLAAPSMVLSRRQTGAVLRRRPDSLPGYGSADSSGGQRPDRHGQRGRPAFGCRQRQR